MIIHIVKNTIREGKEVEYTGIAKEFMAYIKENCHGCISARVMTDLENPNLICNIIEWEDKQAMEDHLAGDSLMKFVDRLGPCFLGNTSEVYEVN